MPHIKQSEIHSDFSTDSAVWEVYKGNVLDFYARLDRSNLDDHITREFNRKIENLGLPENLYITPKDAGGRYIGTNLPETINNSYVRPDGVSIYLRPDRDSFYLQP